jgi:hypothetical protein
VSSRLRAVIVRTTLALAVSASAGCGGGKVLLHLTLDDPHHRLGPAPWTAIVFNPYLGPTPTLLLDPKGPAFGARGTAAPGTPFVITGGLERLAQIMDVEADDAQDFGLALPALRADGYWRARLVRDMVLTPTDNPRPLRNGDARFCRWGEIRPGEEGEVLAIETQQVHAGEVWELRLRVIIPDAAAGAKP